MTTILPRNDQVLILPDGGKTRHGKLYLPQSSVKVPTRGTVVAVGPGYLLADGTRGAIQDLAEGDRVEFSFDPQGNQLDIDGETHFMMKEVFVTGRVFDEPVPEMADPEDTEATPEAAAGSETETAPDPSAPAAMPQRIVLARG